MDPANNFPCACTAAGCKNPEGRIELDVDRIQSHFQKTIIRENPSSITTKSHHQHQTRQSQQSTSESHCSSSQQEMQQHSIVSGSRNNKQNPQHKFFDSYLQFQLNFPSFLVHFFYSESRNVMSRNRVSLGPLIGTSAPEQSSRSSAESWKNVWGMNERMMFTIVGRPQCGGRHAPASSGSCRSEEMGGTREMGYLFSASNNSKEILKLFYPIKNLY
jgi:hypothetical protein